MLREIHIHNFALIDSLTLCFGDGLNILTGETGAGKSIVVGALSLVLGERASADMVRAGADRAMVEAVFDLCDAPPATRERLAAAGLDDTDRRPGAVHDDDEEVLILTRELTRNGKSQCRVNGRLMPVSSLREIADGLIDVHGQHEHQTLLSPERHIDLLDGWLGADAFALREDVGNAFAALGRLRRELEELRSEARERARNLDLYRFQQQEIEAAGLRPGEMEELANERSRLANAEKLAAAAEQAYEALGDAGMDALNCALAAVERAGTLDDALAPIAQQLVEAVSYAEEGRRSLRAYRDTIEFNPARLEEIGDRLDLIHTLQRKYGDTIGEIAAYSQDLQRRLDTLENSEAREAELTRALEHAEKELDRSAGRLSKLRHGVSERFATAVMEEINDLGMAGTVFEVSIQTQTATSKGIDRVEFLISPNPGEPLRPLARIASGGEISRLMLAMKSVLAQAAFVPTLIFDEIDVGVGGRTAGVLAAKLSALALQAQIVCITHLPQIGSQPASAHFHIEKRVAGGRTVVDVRRLDREGRVEEIGRMLGATGSSAIALQHAREMLDSGLGQPELLQTK
jgi:DNA repair protein RecN (Recombination protein N)